jgi:hypothetical protein
VVDRRGPVSSNVTVAPDPNNGYKNGAGNLGFVDSVRVGATLSDVSTGGSDVVLGEVFMDANRPAPTEYGLGAEMNPNNATHKWGGPIQDAYAFIPLPDIRSNPEGMVKLWVHGKDAAGNWGDLVFVSLTLDKTPPVVTSMTKVGTPPNATINVVADDPLSGGVHSNIVAAEWWVGPEPGIGGGNPVSGITPGTHVSFSFSVAGHPAGTTINLRVQDLAGNWSSTSSLVL